MTRDKLGFTFGPVCRRGLAANREDRCGRSFRQGPRNTQVIAVSDNDGRHHEDQEAEADQCLGACASSLPFLQSNAPERAEDDDAGHVKGPTRKLVSTHLGLTHGVEKKLKIPSNSGQSGEEIVGNHRRFQRPWGVIHAQFARLF
jgi:hypothetical protein